MKVVAVTESTHKITVLIRTDKGFIKHVYDKAKIRDYYDIEDDLAHRYGDIDITVLRRFIEYIMARRQRSKQG